MSKIQYVNLGCGNRFHPDWINIDFISSSPDVIAHNLLLGIPLENDSVNVVYHSHVLEHFPREKASGFLKECNRVLKPGGIIRIAIPDLGQIIAHYVRLTSMLQTAPTDSQLWADYDWIMLELYDQTVRNRSGGSMGNYLTSGKVTNRDFILARCGDEVKNILDNQSKYVAFQESSGPPRPFNLWKELYRLVRYGNRRDRFRRMILGAEYDLLNIGRFRMGGEIHQWMYDRFSLKRILEASGFIDFEVKTAFDSNIPRWSSFNLDGKDGKVRKPDSLFVEAKKPLA